MCRFILWFHSNNPHLRASHSKDIQTAQLQGRAGSFMNDMIVKCAITPWKKWLLVVKNK